MNIYEIYLTRENKMLNVDNWRERKKQGENCGNNHEVEIIIIASFLFSNSIQNCHRKVSFFLVILMEKRMALTWRHTSSIIVDDE